jgi:hypothetical protein
MRCTFQHDFEIDISFAGDTSQAQTRFVPTCGPGVDTRYSPRREQLYIPKGTTAECQLAPYYCDRGIARPADEECANACRPYTDEERAARELEYRADLLGVIPEDRELFRQGIIAGYREVKGQIAFLPGPNWKQYQQEKAKRAAQAAQQDEGI